MNDETTPSTTDDGSVEAHGISSNRGPAQPAETEAHGLSARGRDEDRPAKGEREDARDDGPDVEGHAACAGR